MRDFTDKDYEQVLGVDTDWRDISADKALNELKAAVFRAKTTTAPKGVVEAVLWYRVLLEVLDDRDDLGQLWRQLKNNRILPTEWLMWQRYTDRALRD